MLKRLSLAALLVLLLPMAAHAQYPQACNGTITNAKGSSGGDITCDNTSGGVSLLSPNQSRCAVTMLNTSSNTVRICDTSVPTCDSSHGFTLIGGASLTLGPESSRETYKCIQTGASSGTLNTIEAVQKGIP